MVTAELALALLWLTAVVLGLAAVAGLVLLQIRSTDSAAEIARQVARGDVVAAARAKDAAPDTAVITVDSSGTTVRVVVASRVEPIKGQGGFDISARAVAQKELG